MLAQSGNAAVIEDQSWAGIEFIDVTPQVAERNGLARPAGVFVLSVTPHGGAGKAGLRAGDVILAIDGRPALDGADLDDILDDIWPGRTVRFVVLRSGERVDLDVTLGGIVGDNRAEAKAGNAVAMHLLGVAHAYGRGTAKNIAVAVKWLRKAADLGNPDAQFELAGLYGSGDGVPKDDAMAVRWLKKAAAHDHGRAQAFLALRYYKGQGVVQDKNKALRWYRAAARNEDTMGAVTLGILHLRGTGVAKDDAKAIAYFRLAADKGSASATNNLAFMYWNGRGVKRDEREAARLWRLAALKGSASAKKSLTKHNIEPYDAAEIQRLLTELGYDPGPVDGRPGRKTRTAIKEYQTDNGLNVTATPSVDVYSALVIAGQELRRAELIELYALKPAPAPEAPSLDEDDEEVLEGLD